MSKLIRKKIVLIGGFAVGKSSLVRRFVENEFSDEYVSTLGVSTMSKGIEVNGQQVELIIWDIAGDDDFMRLRKHYLRGSSGVLLVVDHTRPESVETIAKLRKEVEGEIGPVPDVVLANKSDLPRHKLFDETMEQFGFMDWTSTSAKSGEHVDDAFRMLGSRML